MHLLKKDLEKYTPRKEQVDTMEFLKNAIQENAKFLILDLPTGTGKSNLAMMFIDWYLKNVNKDTKFDLVSESKLLQTQYTDDFSCVSNLWGRNGYQCHEFSCNCEEGKEFGKLTKTGCEGCPYDNDKNAYIKNQISLTNFHMFFTLKLYQQDMMKQRESKVLIVDEAHAFEDVFSGFISITISEYVFKRLKFPKEVIDKLTTKLAEVYTIDDFAVFTNSFLKEELGAQIKYLERAIGGDKNKKAINRNLRLNNLLGDKSDLIDLVKIKGEADSLLSKIENFIKDYNEDSSNWLLEQTSDEHKKKSISIETVWSHKYLDKFIWSKYDTIIMMSGTILDKNMFCFLNGIPTGNSRYYSIPSPFDVKNRPIYYIPVSRYTYSTKQAAFDAYVPFIKKLLEKYKNKKGIIHTFTFELSQMIRKTIKNKRLIFHTTEDKDYALKKHYNTFDPTVLVSPSMGTGVNLEQDRARFQILLKMPYPSLASNKVKMRMKMNSDFYSYRTCQNIIQIYGRAIRDYTDYADFIILDGCFSDVLKYSSKFFPKYILDAIKKTDPEKLKQSM